MADERQDRRDRGQADRAEHEERGLKAAGERRGSGVAGVQQVSGTPGFVAGYWVRLDGARGTAVVVFESENAARSAAAEAQPPGDLIAFDSVEVGEVVANA